MNVEESRLFKTIQKIINIVFVYSAFVFVPLYYTDDYFNTLEDKANALVFCGAVICLLFLVLFLISHKQVIEKIKKTNWNYFDVSVFVFVVASAISTLLSYNRKYAFDGSQGYRVGFLSILTLFLIYIVMRIMFIKLDNKHYIIPILVTIFILLLSILNLAGIDILNMKKGLSNKQLYLFVSTLGNKNWAAGYVSVLLSFSYVLYIKNKGYECILYSSVLLLSLLNLACLATDSLILAIVVSSGLMALIAFDSVDSFKKTALIIIIYGLSLFTVSSINAFDREIAIANHSSFSKYLFNKGIIILIILIGSILYLFGLSVKEKEWSKSKNTFKKYTKYFMYLLIVSLILYVVLTFDKDFGNGRGEIWIESVKAYSRLPVLNKIFGTGPEMLRNVYASLSTREDIIYSVSHSEAVQVFVTMGIVGLFSYMNIWMSLLIKCARKNSLVLCVLISYFVQSLVNSATCCNLLIILTVVIINESMTWYN